MGDNPNNSAESGSALAKLRESLAPLFAGSLRNIRGNKLRYSLQAVAGVLILLIFGGVWSWLHRTVETSTHQEISLAAALKELDNKQYSQARLIAEKLRYSTELSVDELGGPLFVLGAAAAYEAEDAQEKDNRTYHLLSTGYLEEARDRGFPEQRRPEGIFLLGRGLFLSQQLAAGIPHLEESLVLYPSRKTEILGYLTQAYMAGNSPNYNKALAANEQYLADPRLPLADRHRALLARAQMLFAIDEHDRCLKTLELIPPTALNRGEVIVLEGRLRMREAADIQRQLTAARALIEDDSTPTAEQAAVWKEMQGSTETLYREAVKDFRRAQGQDNSSNIATRQALYLTGLCQIELNELDAALLQLGKARRQYPDSSEGIAAGLAEADLQRRMGKDKEAMENYHRTIKQVTGEVQQQTYKNPWLSLDDFRKRLRDVYDGYLAAGKFEQAIQSTDLLETFFPHVDALRLRAQAYEAWGKGLDQDAIGKPREQARRLQTDARHQFRQAGLHFVRLARLRIAMREFPEDLWNGAESFLAGHDYKSAIKVFEEYLKNESRGRRASALVGLGEARLALGELDPAIQSLNECLQQYPKDPITYRARLLVSEALQEKGETTEAIALLQENLGSLQLTPDSIEWRDSLFELGRLQHTAGQFREAIPRLEEAVERYPQASQALESRYLIADSYRQAAKEPIEKLETITIEASRAAATAELKHMLGESLKQYKQVQVELSRRSDVERLSPLEQAILRNCYFARGAILFDLGKYEAGAYEQAILAFSDTTNIYQHEPEVLDAFLLIAACNRRLNKPVEARGALEQAKVVLKQIDENASFSGTTNFSRDEWTKVLDWLSTL